MSKLTMRIKGVLDGAETADLTPVEEKAQSLQRALDAIKSDISVADELADQDLCERVWDLFYAFSCAWRELDDAGDESGSDPSPEQYEALIDELCSMLKDAFGERDDAKGSSKSLFDFMTSAGKDAHAFFTASSEGTRKEKGLDTVSDENKQGEPEPVTPEPTEETPKGAEPTTETTPEAPAEPKGATMDDVLAALKDLTVAIAANKTATAPDATKEAPAEPTADQIALEKQAELDRVNAELAKAQEAAAKARQEYDEWMSKAGPSPLETIKDTPVEDFSSLVSPSGFDNTVPDNSFLGKDLSDFLK